MVKMHVECNRRTKNDVCKVVHRSAHFKRRTVSAECSPAFFISRVKLIRNLKKHEIRERKKHSSAEE